QPAQQPVGALRGQGAGLAQHDHVREGGFDHGGQVVRGGLFEGDPQVVVPVDRQILAITERNPARRLGLGGDVLLRQQGSPLTQRRLQRLHRWCRRVGGGSV